MDHREGTMHILRLRLIGIICLCGLLIWQPVLSQAAPVASSNGLRPIVTRYSGPADLVAMFDQNAVQPLSLATADLDEDGISDVIAGYRTSDGTVGSLATQRGNTAALYPYSAEAHAQRAAAAFSDAPLLPDVTLTRLPEAPTFLVSGDFNGDGHADVLAAATGGQALY